jgi:hypothetical protein
MYEISKSCVKVSNGITYFFPIKVGVKQIVYLIPNLFKIFINDFPDYTRNCPDLVLLHDKPIHCLMYPDDIILLFSTAKGFQAKLDILDSYCNDWCLTVNPTKAKILVFNLACRHLHHKFIMKHVNLNVYNTANT